MANVRAAIPKGTRDFGPVEMTRRNHIYNTIKKVFKKYGYQEIQTPTMENLDTLTGKYGDEGDKLIFKIIESGEYAVELQKSIVANYKDAFKKSTRTADSKIVINKIADKFLSNLKVVSTLEKGSDFFEWISRDLDYPSSWNDNYTKLISDFLYKKGSAQKFKRFDKRIQYYLSIKDNNPELRSELLKGLKYVDSNRISPLFWFGYSFISAQEATRLISKKALRYDLTVPFARYVVQHQNEITFPFKRFQIQPVWRADRPQKGRYREFYQCDADVVGSDSLLNEAEFICVYDEALSNLGLKDFTIKINNRKILSGIAELIGKPNQIVDMTVAIDKLDKIGLEGVEKELLTKDFTHQDLEILKPVILLSGSNEEKLAKLAEVLASSATGQKGIEEIKTVFQYLSNFKIRNAKIELDLTLARGLNYYTGCIFEVKTNEVAMGSIGGGGRYDDLTGMFGLSNLTGAGISFGADRIYDVLEELNLFPSAAETSTKVLICVFGKEEEQFAIPVLAKLREQDISAELYPFGAKIKKQMQYANDKNIAYTIVIGEDEMASGKLTFKNMQSGEQKSLAIEEIIGYLKQ